MRASSIRRLAGFAVSSILAGAMLLSVAGVAVASPPNWDMQVTLLPSSVTPGAPAGYHVTIHNGGASNISALYLVDDNPATPVYLVSDRPGTCGETGSTPPSGPLFCSFGALNAFDSVSITVAYTTPTTGTSTNITFQANTTGSTFSDGLKNRSHGDQLTLKVTTALSSNKNFAGTFSTVTGTSVGDSDTLSGNNKQSTKVNGIPAGVGATVEDGTGTTGSCTTTDTIDCSKLFGEWSVVNVGTGGPFSPAITIQITYKNGTPTAFVHSTGTTQELVKSCAETGGALPCFTWDVATSTATITTLFNGSWKGL
jgi:uncharacterized protein DUF11